MFENAEGIGGKQTSSACKRVGSEGRRFCRQVESEGGGALRARRARLRGGRPAEFRRQSRRNVRPGAAYTHLTSYCSASCPVEHRYVKTLSRLGSSKKHHKNNSRKTGSYKYVPLKALLHARCKEGLLLLPAKNGFVNGVQILRGIVGDNDLSLLLIPVNGHSGSQPAAECSGHTPQIGISGFFAAPVGIQ